MALTTVDPLLLSTQAQYTGFKNKLINGNFNIWQRGTSFPVTASVNAYSADRWRTEGYPVNSNISQQTFTVGQTDVPGYPTYYCRVTVTSAPSVYWAFQQRIEAPQNITGNGTYALSFYVKAVSGTIAANTFSFGLSSTLTSCPVITTAWQKITVPITISSVDISTGYLSLYLINITSAISALSVDVANIQLEVGTQATSFDYRPYGTELALCQRYYYKIFPNRITSVFGVIGYATSTTTSILVGTYPVTLRTEPTTLEQSGTAGDYATRSFSGGIISCSSVPTYAALTNAQAFRVNFIVAAGLTAGQSVFGETSSTGSAGYLAWSAEL